MPGGFAERVRANGWVELPESVDDARGTYVEPLACVLRGAERVPRGRVLIVGNGFIGRLFGAVLERRGDTVFAVDRNPLRAGREPDGPVDAAVVCAPGGIETSRLRRWSRGDGAAVRGRAGGAGGGGVPAGADGGGVAVGDAGVTWSRRWRCCRSWSCRSRRWCGLEGFAEAVRLFREGRC